MSSFEHHAVALAAVNCRAELLPLLEASSARHRHLCPRQVIGVRAGLAGARALALDAPRSDKRLLVIVETDGCFISGVEAASGCSPNRRTLRIVDYGRIAATFVDVRTEQAVRVAPLPTIRQRAWHYAEAGERRRYFAMLTGYQQMPEHELLSVTPVRLTTPLRSLISRAGVRVDCSRCGEEVINEREVIILGATLCFACAGDAYYAS